MEGVEWLGLLDNYKEIKLTEINDFSHLIGVSPNHCYYVSNGIIDNYGKPISIDESKSKKSFNTETLINLI